MSGGTIRVGDNWHGTQMPNYASCGCYIGPWLGIIPPDRCPMHAMTPLPSPPTLNQLLDDRKPMSANPADWYRKLSDADVERIAQRVVERMRETKP